jgi:hypothetical protein
MSSPTERLPDPDVDLVAVPPSADGSQAAVSGKPAPAVSQIAAPRRGRRVVFAALGLIVLSAGGGAAWLMLGRGFGQRPKQANAQVEAAPLAPPPALEFALDSPVSASVEPNAGSAAGFAERVDRIPGLAAALAAEGSKQAEGLIVLPGRQAKSQSESDVRHERWEIRLPPDVTLESYARQLDFFGIELGIIGGTDEVVYLSHLAEPQPKQRTAVASREGRLYMTWQRGGLAEADRKIAAHAKINTKGKLIAMFCPPRIEKELADLERAAAKDKKIDVVQKTVFGILPDGQGFKFHVITQEAGGDAAANR